MSKTRLIAGIVLGAALTVGIPASAGAASRTVDSRTADRRTAAAYGHPVHTDFRLGYTPKHSRLPGVFFRL